MKSLALLVVLVVLVQLFDGSDAECCRPIPGYHNGQVTLNCGDCKPGTPYCGVGRCNMWGCNCDGGCRKGTCNGFFKASELVDVIDKDHDGKMSTAEGRAFLTSMNIDSEHVEETFTHAEAAPDADGFLTVTIFEEEDNTTE